MPVESIIFQGKSSSVFMLLYYDVTVRLLLMNFKKIAYFICNWLVISISCIEISYF